jgi:D-threo-aldose 1-dehydrogenase
MNARDAVQLGRTPVKLSRVGFGSASIAGLFEAVTEHEAHAVVARTIELELGFIDTAPVYGFGVAEERLGRALAGVPRDAYTLATKVGRLLEPGAPVSDELTPGGAPLFVETPPVNPVFGFSRDDVLRSLEESMARLAVDRIDLVHVHDPDHHVAQALDEAYPTLAELRSEGVIGAVGIGTASVDTLVAVAREADVDCVLVPGRYTLLDQSALPELLPLCERRDIAIIIGGVYNSGILADPVSGARFDYRPAPRDLLTRARRLDAICARHGVPLKAAANQFPFGHPMVTSVLSGARSVAELEENVRMFEIPVPASMWDELRSEGLLPVDAPLPVS